MGPVPDFDIPNLLRQPRAEQVRPAETIRSFHEESAGTLLEPGAPQGTPDNLRIPNREGSVIDTNTQEMLLYSIHNKLDYGENGHGGKGMTQSGALLNEVKGLLVTDPEAEEKRADIQMISDPASKQPVGVRLTLYGSKQDKVYTLSRVVDQVIVEKSVEKHIKARDLETGAAMNGLYKAASKRRTGKNAQPVWIEEQEARKLVDTIGSMEVAGSAKN